MLVPFAEGVLATLLRSEGLAGWVPRQPAGVAAMLGIGCGFVHLFGRGSRHARARGMWQRGGLVRKLVTVLGLSEVVHLGRYMLDPLGEGQPPFPASGTPELMMRVALVWLVGIRAGHLVLDPESRPEGERVWETATKGMLWYVMPMHRVPEGTPTVRSDVRGWAADASKNAAFFLALAAGKTAMHKLAHTWLMNSLQLGEPGTVTGAMHEAALDGGTAGALRAYGVSVARCAVSALMVVAGTAQMDILRALTPIVTGGYYKGGTFIRAPIASQSVGDFWSRRYNLLVSANLRDSVYNPLRSYGLAGLLGKQDHPLAIPLAKLAAFSLSGALHVHVVDMVFHEGHREAMLFFVLQALPILLEDYQRGRRSSPKGAAAPPAADAPRTTTLRTHWRQLAGTTHEWSWSANARTLAFLCATFPLYVGTLTRMSFVMHQDPLPDLTAANSNVLNLVHALPRLRY